MMLAEPYSSQDPLYDTVQPIYRHRTGTDPGRESPCSDRSASPPYMSAAGIEITKDGKELSRGESWP